jgi:hypothetical protein
VFVKKKTKNPSAWEGLFRDEGLGYVFALAGIWFVLARLAAGLLLAALLLLTTLLFLASALVLRSVALLTLLATLLPHATLFTLSFHSCLHFRTALDWVHCKESRLLHATQVCWQPGDAGCEWLRERAAPQF